MVITVLPEWTYNITFEIKPKIPPHQEVTNMMTNVSESEKRNIRVSEHIIKSHRVEYLLTCKRFTNSYWQCDLLYSVRPTRTPQNPCRSWFVRQCSEFGFSICFLTVVSLVSLRCRASSDSRRGRVRTSRSPLDGRHRSRRPRRDRRSPIHIRRRPR